MTSTDKIKNWALILLLLGMLSSCRQPDDGYNYEDNDEPLTGLSQFNEKAIKSASLEHYAADERVLITKV